MRTTDAMDALRRRYDERVRLARTGEARKYAAQAATALASGELVAAANAFRIAANLAPEELDLERRAQEARLKADALLSDTYSRQALYEETHDQWGMQRDRGGAYAKRARTTPTSTSAPPMRFSSRAAIYTTVSVLRRGLATSSRKTRSIASLSRAATPPQASR